MSSLFFYRARVETTKGREMIPVFAFKSGDATPVWPDINVKSLADLQMITSMADGARALTICTYTYLVNRAFPGRDVSFFELAVHDAWDTKSPPTSERRIVAMITGRDMSVPHKHTINFKLPQMTSEAISSLDHGQLSAVALSMLDSDEGLTFQRV